MIGKIMMVALLICGISLIVIGFMEYNNEDPTEFGDCYDRYGNKILGQTCEIDNTSGVAFTIGMGVFICIMSVMALPMDQIIG